MLQDRPLKNAMDHSNLDDLKATALVAGYLKDCVANKRAADLQDAAGEFARLLAQLTSTDNLTRERAKTRVRELAVAGGWRPEKAASKTKAKAAPSTSGKETGAPAKKAPGRWTVPEEERLYTAWISPNSKRDGEAVKRLSDTTGRSPLAIIIRLYQLGAYGLEKGDDLCRAVGAVKLLSECEAQRGDPLPAPIPAGLTVPEY